MYRVPVTGDPQPFGDRMPSLVELQTWVGGYVEHVGLQVNGQECHLFVNEDGRRLGLMPNEFATGVYGAQFDERELRLAIGQDPRTLDGLTIVGNAWLWHGPLPADA